jgi:activator of HSP90 ATPase
MKTRTIRQTVTFPVKPIEVYEALMTTRGHAAFTGAAARISPKVGGTFTAWDGYIHGRNLVLVRGKRIVQAWRPSEESWPADHYSTVTFVLEPTLRGTRLKFTHSGVPVEHAGHLSEGWKSSYWVPMRAYFARRP